MFSLKSLQDFSLVIIRPSVYKDTQTHNVFLSVLIYRVDKVQVAGVVSGDNGEDVPVVFLHDVQHDGGLLLNGWTKLKKHGVVVLETRDTEPISK